MRWNLWIFIHVPDAASAPTHALLFFSFLFFLQIVRKLYNTKTKKRKQTVNTPHKQSDFINLKKNTKPDEQKQEHNAERCFMQPLQKEPETGNVVHSLRTESESECVSSCCTSHVWWKSAMWNFTSSQLTLNFYFVFFREYTVFGGGVMCGAQSLMFFALSEKASGDSLEFQRHPHVDEKRFRCVMTS